MIRNIDFTIKLNDFDQYEAFIMKDEIKYWSMSDTLEKAMFGCYLEYYANN